MVPLAVLDPKRRLDQFIRFAGLTLVTSRHSDSEAHEDTRTDHATGVPIGRILTSFALRCRLLIVY